MAMSLNSGDLDAQLFDACGEDDLGRVVELLEAGADPNAWSAEGRRERSVAMVAAFCAGAPVLEALERFGADFLAESEEGLTALFHAALGGRVDALAFLWERQPAGHWDDPGPDAGVARPARLGHHPAFGAVDNPDPAALDWILDARPDWVGLEDELGMGLIGWACFSAKPAALASLLRRLAAQGAGASDPWGDAWGEAAAHLSERAEDLGRVSECIRVLKSHGMPLDAFTGGVPVLTVAVRSGKPGVALALLAQGFAACAGDLAWAVGKAGETDGWMELSLALLRPGAVELPSRAGRMSWAGPAHWLAGHCEDASVLERLLEAVGLDEGIDPAAWMEALAARAFDAKALELALRLFKRHAGVVEGPSRQATRMFEAACSEGGHAGGWILGLAAAGIDPPSDPEGVERCVKSAIQSGGSFFGGGLGGEKLRALAQAGAPLDALGRSGEMLHLAVESSSASALEELLRLPGLDLERRGAGGATPFLRACAMGSARMARALLAAGAREDALDGEGRDALDSHLSGIGRERRIFRLTDDMVPWLEGLRLRRELGGEVRGGDGVDAPARPVGRSL